MGMKMKLVILLTMLMISIVSTQDNGMFPPGNFNSTNGHQTENSNQNSWGWRRRDDSSNHSSRHEKNGVGVGSMFGSSTSRYRYRKRRDFNAKGKFRSRGIGRYGIMSSETTHYIIEGKFDRYGRRRPTKSKFKTRGKEKKYSRRINDNRFDIKGGLYERRQHEGMGDYQANGSFINVKLRTKEHSHNSNGGGSGTDSSSHSNSTRRNEQNMWRSS
ncbi:hypothetical protein MN116_000577 [Schistosoma mekongi]|uniref:Trematode Eggshell Synthesis domain containing protein n=1 Tax=Schistosoma mekongi TaxID=38744 RepID=A0AAE1ZB72_SCHME|nr:hypothetical protein MN116_000577 [Schistosoma mekongi]